MAETFDPYHKWLGIPKPEQPPHHYRLLGVGLFEIDPDVIEGAADRQMAHVQTHKAGPHSAVSQRVLNELSAAKICLLNPKKKEAYDATLRQKLAASAAPASATPVTAVAVPVASVLLDDAEDVLAGVLPAGPAVSTITKGRSATRQRQKKPQYTALIILGLAAVLVAVLAFASLQFFGDATKVPPEGNGTARPSTIVQNDPSQPVSPEGKPNGSGKPPVRTPPPDKTKSGDEPKPKKSQTAPEKRPPEPTIKNEKPDFKRPDFKQPVDLLKLANLSNDVMSGAWELDRGVLSSSDDEHAVMQFAVDPPDDYRLTIDVQPGEKYESLYLGVPVAGRTVMAVIDGWERTASGLHKIDQAEANNNETTNRDGPCLKQGESNTVMAEVRKSGFVRVVVNGQQIFEWRGEPSRLSHHEMWAPVKHAGRPFLGGSYGYKFTRVELESLPPAAAPKIVQQPKTKPKPKNEPDENQRGDLTSVETGPKNKQPVPDKSELAAERIEIHKTFKDEFAAARNPVAKGGLADKLFHYGLDPSEKMPHRYALLEEARGLAAEAGQVELLLNCIKELRKAFDVDAIALQCDSLAVAAKVADIDQQRLAQSCLEKLDEALEKDRYLQAAKLGVLAKAAAVKAKDNDLRKTATEKEALARRLAKDQEALAAARDKLEADADDAEANLAIGRHLCLVRDEWDEGLPMLVKGSDAGLKKIAESELAQLTDAEEQGHLADAWWEAAASAPAADREMYKDRARHWYEQIVSGLAGARKSTVEVRLGIKSGGTASAATSPLDLLLKKAQNAVKTKKLNPSSPVGSNRTAKAFDEVNKDGGLLVGFTLTLRSGNDDTYINSLQPIFLTAAGKKTGSTYGRVNRTNTMTIEAKEGYAVTMISVRANPNNNSNYLTGLQLTFGKIAAKQLGRKPADLYESEWVGDANQAGAQTLGVPGKPILGIFGFERNSSDYPTALGIYVLP